MSHWQCVCPLTVPLTRACRSRVSYVQAQPVCVRLYSLTGHAVCTPGHTSVYAESASHAHTIAIACARVRTMCRERARAPAWPLPFLPFRSKRLRLCRRPRRPRPRRRRSSSSGPVRCGQYGFLRPCSCMCMRCVTLALERYASQNRPNPIISTSGGRKSHGAVRLPPSFLLPSLAPPNHLIRDGER